MFEILVDPKKRKVLREQLREYSRAVAAGADPIEALHGHKCGSGCMHGSGGDGKRARGAARMK